MKSIAARDRTASGRHYTLDREDRITRYLQQEPIAESPHRCGTENPFMNSIAALRWPESPCFRPLPVITDHLIRHSAIRGRKWRMVKSVEI